MALSNVFRRLRKANDRPEVSRIPTLSERVMMDERDVKRRSSGSYGGVNESEEGLFRNLYFVSIFLQGNFFC